MKLNYYTYTVTTTSGETSNVNIKDIVDLFCKFQKDSSKIEKINPANAKALYFAQSEEYGSIYYLMTPVDLKTYRTLNKTSGTIRNLKEFVGSDSLEKVTYIHFDDKLAVMGIASPRGAAIDDDFQFYLNEIINEFNDDQDYVLKLKPIQAGIKKSDVTKLRMITEAKVLLQSGSLFGSKFSSLLLGKDDCQNIEIEVRVKRTKGAENSISNDIAPLLEAIQSDSEEKEFAKVLLRGKQHSLSELVRDMHLDRSMILSDILNPNLKASIEEQIHLKRFANQSVDDLAITEFNKYASKLHKRPSCPNWTKLSSSSSYEVK
ncbi:conserved hypothetical protein [Vibrio chagasii]|nr:conserved hypothetical protein [Vibrio chagasii]